MKRYSQFFREFTTADVGFSSSGDVFNSNDTYAPGDMRIPTSLFSGKPQRRINSPKKKKKTKTKKKKK